MRDINTPPQRKGCGIPFAFVTLHNELIKEAINEPETPGILSENKLHLVQLIIDTNVFKFQKRDWIWNKIEDTFYKYHEAMKNGIQYDRIHKGARKRA